MKDEIKKKLLAKLKKNAKYESTENFLKPDNGKGIKVSGGSVMKIDTKTPQKQILGFSFRDKIAKLIKSKALKKGAKYGLKMLPIVGGLAAAIASGDASAAMPDALSSEPLAPKKGSTDHDIENPDMPRKKIWDKIKKLINKDK